jgi:hypothetical protein
LPGNFTFHVAHPIRSIRQQAPSLEIFPDWFAAEFLRQFSPEHPFHRDEETSAQQGIYQAMGEERVLDAA